MIRGIGIATSLFLAAFLEWWSGGAEFGGIQPPLILAAFVFWCLRLSLVPRVWLTLVTGFFLESVSLLPFGSYLGVMIFLAAATEVLSRALSSLEAPVVYSMAAALLLFPALLFLSLVSYPASFPASISAALVWSAIFFLVLGGMLRIKLL